MKHSPLLFLIAAVSAFSQATFDATGNARTAPFARFSADPGTCRVGDYYDNTTTGLLRRCTALNTWTDFGVGGGSYTSGTSDPATCTPGTTPDFWNTTSLLRKYCSATNTWTTYSSSAAGFNALTSGTNTTAGMLVGTGASLAATGTGSITATSLTYTATGTGAVARTQGAVNGQYLSVADFGAVGDQRTVLDASMSSSTSPTNLTSATAAFVSGDIGKSVAVLGAGNVGGILYATISSITSGTVAVLSTSALTTVSAATATIGTDNKPAFDNAFTRLKALKGGTLLIPAGTYTYNNSTSNLLDLQTFTLEASNITVKGDGSTATMINFLGDKGLYLGLPRADINRYCTTPPATGCTAPAWGLPTYYLINNVTGGASVTTTTAAQAGNFSPGQNVFIESGDAAPTTGHPPAHFEYNVVLTVNASTGVITLANPLADAYDSGNASYVPMITAVATLPNHIVIKDLGVTSPVASVLLSYEGVINASIQNVSISSSIFHADIYNGFSQNVELTKSSISGGEFDLGDSGSYTYITDNNIVNSIFNSGGGGKWFFIQRNLISGVSYGTCCNWGINMAGSASSQFIGLNIRDNAILLSSVAQFGGAIQVSYANTPIVTGNRIYGASTAASNSQVGINIENTVVDATVAGNLIDSTYLSVGIRVQAGSGAAPTGTTVSGNTVVVPGTGLYHTATGTIIDCNSYFGTSANLFETGATGTIKRCLTEATINAAQVGGITVTGTPAAGYVPTATSTTAATWQAAGGVAAGTYFQTFGYNGGTLAATANTVSCAGIVIPTGGLSVGKISYDVSTGDATNNSDVGIYGSTGTLLADVGASHINPSGPYSSAISGGTKTIPAGKAYFCITSVAATFAIKVYSNEASFYPFASTGIASTAGALPGSITPPANSFGTGSGALVGLAP